jgi:hypothetical protein
MPSELLSLPQSLFFYIGDRVGREKISFGISGAGGHYTLTNNAEKKSINLHYTSDNRSEGSKADRLFEIKHSVLQQVMEKLTERMSLLSRQYFFSRRINLGRLKKHGLLCVSHDQDSYNWDEFLEKRGKHLKTRKAIREDTMDRLIKYPEELTSDRSRVYSAYSSQNNSFIFQGLLFRDPSARQGRRFFFLTRKQFDLFAKEQMHEITKVLQDVEFEGRDEILKIIRARR